MMVKNGGGGGSLECTGGSLPTSNASRVVAPITCGSSTTGLTSPASAAGTATALTAISTQIYAEIS